MDSKHNCESSFIPILLNNSKISECKTSRGPYLCLLGPDDSSPTPSLWSTHRYFCLLLLLLCRLMSTLHHSCHTFTLFDRVREGFDFTWMFEEKRFHQADMLKLL